MKDHDFCVALRVRAKALRALGKVTYDEKLREVIWMASFVLSEAAEEIQALRDRITQLEKLNSPKP